MKRQRKTRDEFTLQGYYGSHGWEDLTTEDTWKEARAQKRCYQENEGGAYRIIKRRVKLTTEELASQCKN